MTSLAGKNSEGRAADPGLDPSGLTAVIFAGASGPPAEQGGRNKNYFKLRGRPVVQVQLDLLRDLQVGRIVLVTEPHRVSELDLPPGTITLPSSRLQSENFATVKECVPFGEDEHCLVLFGDTPVLTAGVVRDFLERCAARPADFHHGLVPYVFAEPFMDFFPRDHQGRRPFHLKEFTARLGCLSLIRPAVFDPAATRRAVATVMSGRKQDPDGGGLLAVLVARARVFVGGLRYFGPRGAWMGIAAIVSHWLHERGFPRGARFTARPIILSRLEAVASRLVGCRARFIACPFGGPSLDIDGEADLEVHERYFDQMLQLQALQERLVTQLIEPGFEISKESLAWLERRDPAAAAELRRHPEVYRAQRRILLEHASAAGKHRDAA